MNTSSNNIDKESTNTSAERITTGKITAIRGSIVDIQFQQNLPVINSVIRTGNRMEIIIEVQLQLDTKHVRGIALIT